MFKNLLFIISYLFTIPYSFAGWLLWDSVEFIPPHKHEQTVKDWHQVLGRIPQTAVSKKNNIIDITLLIISRQSDIHRFLNEIGWQEISQDMMKSISNMLKEISSGRRPTKFPPARKWFLGDEKQDLSFAKYVKDKRVELYLWRSPFKIISAKNCDSKLSDSGQLNPDLPLWYGAIAETFYKTKFKQVELLKFFQDDVKKYTNANKKIKIRSVPIYLGRKIKKKELLVIEIPHY